MSATQRTTGSACGLTDGLGRTPVGSDHGSRLNPENAHETMVDVGSVSDPIPFAPNEGATMSDANTLPYRMLGRTGLQVSVFSYGFWATFGVKEGLTDDAGIEQQWSACAWPEPVELTCSTTPKSTVHRGKPSACGRGHRSLLEARGWRRSDILITTKIFWGGDSVNEKDSLESTSSGASDALDRLQADYVDLIFCHRPDPLTPTETVVRAMTDVVRSGMATGGAPRSGPLSGSPRRCGLRGPWDSSRHW